MGKMVLTVLGMVAGRDGVVVLEGAAACRHRGCEGKGRLQGGRPPTFDHAKIVALRKQGKGATEIARAVGCQRGKRL